MPVAKPRSWSSLRHLPASADTQPRISMLIRAARPHGSGQNSGSLNQTIKPSPVKRSTVPSNLSTSAPSPDWYSRSTAMTSSGAAVSPLDDALGDGEAKAGAALGLGGGIVGLVRGKRPAVIE